MLIVAIISIAVSIYDKTNHNGMIEAEKITVVILDNHDLSFATNGTIDKDKLKEIQSMDYDQLKSRFNVKGDFCMYLEDSSGKIILAKGSRKLINDEAACRE